MHFLNIYNQTNSNMFLFGEWHGTNETPYIFINALKDAMSLNKHINIFLEISASMQQILNNYINNKISYKIFRENMIFTKEGFDGRETKSFFKIFDFIKDNKNQITPYCVCTESSEPNQDFEGIMKDNICKYYDKSSINFFYAGTCHVVTKKIPPSQSNLWKIFTNHNYLPCGYLVKEKIPCTISIQLKPVSGKTIALAVDPITFNNPKVMYCKFKNETKTIKTYNEYLKMENKEFDFVYNIKRVTAAHRLK